MDEVKALILGKIRRNELRLPVLPDVALHARQVADSPECGQSDLVQVVSQDQAIATRLLQVANSSIYRTHGPIRSLSAAVDRLGENTVATLVISLANKSLFHAKDPRVRSIMQERWSYTAQVAAISRHIATQHDHLDPDEALLKGLLHSVGGAPIIALAERIPKLLHPNVDFDSIIDALQPEVGKIMLSEWGFPKSFVELVDGAHNLAYDHDGEIPDYVDAVIAAIAQTKGLTQTEEGSPVPAAERLGIDLESSLIDDEIDEAIRALVA